MKKKKLLKIISTLLIIVTSIALFSTITIKTFVRFHKCEANKDYSYNDETHYHECLTTKFCDKKFTIESHNLSWVIDRKETLDLTGVMHQECKCGYKTNIGTIIDNVPYTSNINTNDDIKSISIYNTVYTNETEEYYSIGKFEDNNKRNANFNAEYTFRYMGEYQSNNIYRSKVGFNLYDKDGNKYSIYALIGSYSDNGYLCVYKNGTTIGSYDCEFLSNDFMEYETINVDFGVFYNGSGYVYGFRFKTVNYELSYFSDNTGTIKNDTSIAKGLSWISETGIYNSSSNSAVDLHASHSSNHSENRYKISHNKGSKWFLNKVYNLE